MNRMIVYFGLILVIVGLVVMALGGLGVRLGRLPGDFVVRRPGFTFYFPLATSIVVSLLLTLILWIVAAIVRR